MYGILSHQFWFHKHQFHYHPHRLLGQLQNRYMQIFQMIHISKDCEHTAECRMLAVQLINRFSRRGVEDMKVIEVESQFYLLLRVHYPSSLAFAGYSQPTDIKVHIGFAA